MLTPGVRRACIWCEAGEGGGCPRQGCQLDICTARYIYVYIVPAKYHRLLKIFCISLYISVYIVFGKTPQDLNSISCSIFSIVFSSFPFFFGFLAKDLISQENLNHFHKMAERVEKCIEIMVERNLPESIVRDLLKNATGVGDASFVAMSSI